MPSDSDPKSDPDSDPNSGSGSLSSRSDCSPSNLPIAAAMVHNRRRYRQVHLPSLVAHANLLTRPLSPITSPPHNLNLPESFNLHSSHPTNPVLAQSPHLSNLTANRSHPSHSLPPSLSSTPTAIPAGPSRFPDQNLHSTSTRPLRQRKLAQLMPYTYDNKRYISVLHNNGWQDAVVRHLNPITSLSPPPQSDSEPDLGDDPLAIGQSPRQSSSTIPGSSLPDSDIGQFVPRKFHFNRPSDHATRNPNRPRPRPRPRPRLTRSASPQLTPPPRSLSPPLLQPGCLTGQPSPSTLPSRSSLPASPSRPRPISTTSRPRPPTHNASRPLARSHADPPSSTICSDPSTTKIAPKRPVQHSKASNRTLRRSPKRRKKAHSPKQPVRPLLHPRSSRPTSPIIIGTSSPSKKSAANTDSNSGADEDSDATIDEEDEEEEEQEEEENLELETLRPKKVKLKLLSRMMPQVYVAKAERDLKLMEQEKRAGKLRLTIDSDQDSDAPSRTKPTRQRRPPRSSSEEPDHQPARPPRPEQPGMTWAAKMCKRLNRSISPGPDHFGMPSRSSTPPRERPSASSSRPQAPPKRPKHDAAISLSDDHALWRTYESANAQPGLNIPPPGYRANNLEQPDQPCWTFKDFTPDFGIECLPVGLAISSLIRYLSAGHLTAFLADLQGQARPPPPGSLSVFETHFSAAMSSDDWRDALSTTTDRLQDELLLWLAEDAARAREALQDTANWLRGLGGLVSSGAMGALTGDVLSEWIRQVIGRVDDLAVDAVNRPEFSQYMLAISWGLFELACRLAVARRRWTGEEDDAAAGEALRHLLRRLLEYGPPVTMGRLKAHLRDDGCTDRPLFDLSAEIWAGLVNVVVVSAGPEGWKPGYLGQDRFWTTLVELTHEHARRAGLSAVAAGEAVCYVAMMVCALGQVSGSDGCVGAQAARLDAHWPVLVGSLGQVPENILAEPLDARARDRRDQYVRALFARVLVLHERWGWRVMIDDGLVERMYKIMNGARLERLAVELGERLGPVDEFPDVLADVSVLRRTSEGEVVGVPTRLKRNDSCFGMFLKTLVAAHRALPRPLGAARERELGRMVSLCNPLRQLSYRPRGEFGQTDGAINAQTRSALVHHCSLFLVYALLLPGTLKRQLSYVCGLYQYSQIDSFARETHLKVWTKVADVLRLCFGGAELRTVIARLAEPVRVLAEEHGRLKMREKAVRERVQAEQRRGFVRGPVERVLAAELKETTDAVADRARLAAETLRTVERVIKVWEPEEGTYPDEKWVDPAWTSMLEEASLGRDPAVLEGVYGVLQALLDRRRRALAVRSEAWVRLRGLEAAVLEEEEAAGGEGWTEVGSAGGELREWIAKVDGLEAGFGEALAGRARGVVRGGAKLLQGLSGRCAGAGLARVAGQIDRVLVSSGSTSLVECIGAFERGTGDGTLVMGYLVGMFEGSRDGYDGAVREEVVRIWVGQLVVPEFSMQAKVTEVVEKLEREAEGIEGTGIFPRQWVAFGCGEGDRVTTAKEWEVAAWEESKRFELGRVEFIDRMFERIVESLDSTTTLIPSRNEESTIRNRSDTNNHHQLKFYKKRIGEMAESISNSYRKLLVINNLVGNNTVGTGGGVAGGVGEGGGGQGVNLKKREEYLVEIRKVLERNLFGPSSSSRITLEERNEQEEQVEEVVVVNKEVWKKVQKVINFDSVPRLRMLKPFVGVV